MTDAWKQLNLAGGGLQSANIRLAALLKRRSRAYLLLLAFPFGLHRAYLEDRRGPWLYRAGALLCAGAFGLEQPVAGGVLAAALTGWALYDIRWIENAIARINKRLRIEVYMSQTRGAPPGYAGRFPDTGTGRPAGGEEARRAPSFSEQERRLRARAAAGPDEAATAGIRGIKPQPKLKDEG